MRVLSVVVSSAYLTPGLREWMMQAGLGWELARPWLPAGCSTDEEARGCGAQWGKFQFPLKEAAARQWLHGWGRIGPPIGSWDWCGEAWESHAFPGIGQQSWLIPLSNSWAEVEEVGEEEME